MEQYFILLNIQRLNTIFKKYIFRTAACRMLLVPWYLK